MRLSLYTYLFENKGNYYLYNSQTGFLTTIPKSVYEALFNGNFDSIHTDALNELKEKGIIVEQDHLYDYYYSSRLKFLSSIGNYDSLNLVIAPTTGCNFACPYCFEEEKEDIRMTPEIIGDLISFINSYQESKGLNITWYGGEPLAAFDIMKDIVLRIKNECQIPITAQSIVTNGYLINNEVISFLRENHFSDIQITFDGMEDNHNKTRCLRGNHKPTFDRIMRNVEKLVKEMPEDFRISLRININKENEQDYAKINKLIKDKFAQYKNIGAYPGFIREPNNDDSMMCFKSLFGKSRYNFYKKLQSQGVNVDLYPKYHNKGCMSCHNSSLIVGPSGELYKCWNDFNHPNKIVGNIKDKTISNPSLVSQYAYDTTIYNDPKCKECKLFPICSGGCAWYRYKNTFEGKKYNLCTFLSDDSILEECLLAKAVEKGKEAVRAF